ncbi:MAG: hypothetical protein D6796_08620, partial [Caldilineae bacterium]
QGDSPYIAMAAIAKGLRRVAVEAFIRPFSQNVPAMTHPHPIRQGSVVIRSLFILRHLQGERAGKEGIGGRHAGLRKTPRDQQGQQKGER